jgi:hypothetical protein
MEAAVPFAREDDIGGRVRTDSISPTLWQMVEELTFTGSQGDVFTVPIGYVTDHATVPRIAVWLIPRSGRWLRGAILHDYLLTDYVAKGLMSSVDADGVFRLALKELGCSWLRRWMMWTGVRWGAAFSRTRKAGWWSTAPAVFAMSVPTLILFGPGMIVVGIELGIYSLLAGITSGGRHWGDLSS